MHSGQQFSFVVAEDIADRMDRVVLINDGRVALKKQQAGDIFYTVEKT